MLCSCFGHHDAPLELFDTIKQELLYLVLLGCDHFLVGHQGAFDRMVRVALCSLREDYPHLRYSIVLAYMPGKQGSLNVQDPNTVFPEELAGVPPRFAIARRNAWMVDQSEFVLFYMRLPSSNTGKIYDYAMRKQKYVIKMETGMHLDLPDA